MELRRIASGDLLVDIKRLHTTDSEYFSLSGQLVLLCDAFHLDMNENCKMDFDADIGSKTPQDYQQPPWSDRSCRVKVFDRTTMEMSHLDR